MNTGGGAWDRYWSAGQAQPKAGGCLPNMPPALAATLRDGWRSFAATLPRRGRLLDLGTGDGAVLAMIRSARADLKLIGVDRATLPRGADGIDLRGSVAMEALPFDDAHFDAVTSQFGIEYAEPEAAAAEAARVLGRGGAIQFVVHHADGAIVAHNRARLDALRWAAGDSGLLARARALVRGRAVAPLPTPASFRQAALEARQRFPGQSVAEEFALAILQALDSPSASAGLDRLERGAADESARIEALCRAAAGAADIAALAQRLESGGLTMRESCALSAGTDRQPFAWLVAARRPG